MGSVAGRILRRYPSDVAYSKALVALKNTDRRDKSPQIRKDHEDSPQVRHLLIGPQSVDELLRLLSFPIRSTERKSPAGRLTGIWPETEFTKIALVKPASCQLDEKRLIRGCGR